MLDIHRRSGKKLEAAVAYAFNASKYEGGGFLIDEETREPIDVGMLREAFLEHEDLLLFFQSVDHGLITISLTEYTHMPAALAPAWKTYKAAVARHKAKARAHEQRQRTRIYPEIER